MKKFLTIILAALTAMTCVLFVGCKKSDATPVNFKYYAAASDMLPALNNGSLEFGLLPEPAASNLQNNIGKDKTWFRLDVQQLYDAESKSYPQAVVMVKQSVAHTYPEIVDALKTQITEGVEWTKQNPADAVSAVNSKLADGLTPSLNARVITSSVVDGCNIYWQDASDAKASVKKYIDEVISVGSELGVSPAVKINDDFFLDGNEAGDNVSETLTVCAPDGAPALAIAKLIADENDLGTGKTVEYKVVSANDIGANLRGSADIVIIPVNAASKLYKANASDTYKMAAVVTHGNLYIMSQKQITVEDLAGKTLGVIGQGLVPDLTLKAILTARSIAYKVAD